MSRWDVAVADKVPDQLRDKLALAIGFQTYKAYRELMDGDRWQRNLLSVEQEHFASNLVHGRVRGTDRKWTMPSACR
jgi:hypothetical protein